MNDYWMKHSKNCLCGCNVNSFLALEQEEKKIVNLVVGAKGAGKTSLINRILAQTENIDVTVVLKECGAASVDAVLLGNDPARVHVFNGASLHLDQQTMLTGYIENLYANASKQPFDHLIIEASGSDSIEQMMQIFYLPRSRPHYQIGSVIAVVDGTDGLQQLSESRATNEQIVMADCIYISKCDLAEDAELTTLTKQLRRINPYAAILRSDDKDLDPWAMLYPDIFGLLQKVHGDESESQAIVLRLDVPLDRRKADNWIRNTFNRFGNRLLRGRGYFQIAGSDYRFDIQNVRKNFHASTEYQWEGTDRRETLVVFMGPDLPDGKLLLSGLKSCIAK